MLTSMMSFVTISVSAAPERIDISDPRITSSGFERGSNLWSNVIGATITVTFTGTSIAMYGTKNGTHGLAEIKIDGVFHSKIDTYGPWLGEERLFLITGLSEGDHTLVLTVLNEKNAAATDYYQDCYYFLANDDGTGGDGGGDGGDGGDSGGDYTDEEISPFDPRVVAVGFERGSNIWSNVIGATITVTFTGTSIAMYGTKNGTHGIAEVKVDGEFNQKVDTYGAYAGTERLFIVNGLSAGEHVLVLTILNEKNPASSDYFKDCHYFKVSSGSGSAPSQEEVNPFDPRVTSSGFERGSNLWSNVIGATITVSFNGTGIAMYGTKNGTHGIAEVKIDGEFNQKVDTYGAYAGTERLFTVNGLENGEHTMVLTILNEKNPASSDYFKDCHYFIIYGISQGGDDGGYVGEWPEPDDVTNIIFDSDMGPDCDDPGALAMLHTYANRGKVNILAAMCSTGSVYGAPCIDAINTYYGRPDIPVGTLKGNDSFLANQTSFNKYIAENYPNDTYGGHSAPDAVDLYREILAAQPDDSVVVICVGPQSNLYNLLLSPPDEHSELTGKQLVEQKVKLLSTMAGAFPSGGEWNAQQDGTATKYVAENWNTPVMYSGFEIGRDLYPGARRSEMESDNPVKYAYDTFTNSTNYGREGWDLTSVLYAVEGLADYWNMKRGTVEFTSGGNNTFDQNSYGNHAYLVKKMNPTAVCTVIDELFVGAKKASSVDAYKLKFTDGSNIIYKLTSNTLNTTLAYRNDGDSSAEYTAYVAVYDETGILIKIGSDKKTLDVGQKDDFQVSLTLEQGGDKSKYSVCVYIWCDGAIAPGHRKFML